MKKTESPQAENGHIDIANELAEKLSSYHLSGNEWMVLWVVFRKTWGWHKKEDKISLTQFEKSTGLSRPSVSDAISKLVGKRVLLANKEKHINVYSFNKLYSQWTSRDIPTTNGSEKSTSRVFGNQLVGKRVHTKETNTKETITNVIGDKSPVKKDFRNKDIEEGIELLRKTFGSVTKQNLNRYALNRLYKKYQKEMVLKVFTYSQKINKDRYAPKVYSFMDLEEKWEKIKAYGISQREHATQKPTEEQRVFTGTDGTRTYKYILVDGERKEVV
jgi:phage replication O-like protein O